MQQLPERVDIIRAAHEGCALVGTMPLDRFKRLKAQVRHLSGHLTAQLTIDQDPQGMRYMHGELSASVVLTCQRCTEAQTVDLSPAVSVAFIEQGAPTDHLPAQYEPAIMAHGMVFLPDLLEDELLLALPMIPLHPLGCTPVHQESPDADLKPNPFAALVSLRNNK